MAEIEKKPVKIVETILRDAHQSLIATRMTTEQMMPIVEKMDKVGYHAVECWGGATFDASLRFLKEDPWERLRKFRDGFKNTKLQMLFRGQNIRIDIYKQHTKSNWNKKQWLKFVANCQIEKHAGNSNHDQVTKCKIHERCLFYEVSQCI